MSTAGGKKEREIVLKGEREEKGCGKEAEMVRDRRKGGREGQM